MTATEFSEWVRTAKRGQRVVYYFGDLWIDRVVPVTDVPSLRDRAFAAGEVGDAAWRAYEAGRVLLTRRKLAAHSYEYMATRAGV